MDNPDFNHTMILERSEIKKLELTIGDELEIKFSAKKK
jgi:hypothetical protein